MLSYILRRLLLMIPTLLGIMALNFLIVQAAPGGPIEQIVAKRQGSAVEAAARVSGAGGQEASGAQAQAAHGQNAAPPSATNARYKGAQGIDPELILELERQFGFDKPLHVRFLNMIGRYMRFDFGTSYFRDEKVVDLVLSKMPVSVSLGLWTTLIVYLVSIPLGIRKAVRDGTPFDIWTSAAIVAGYAIPGFLFAVLLVIVFAGGRYLDWFPLRGLVSDNWQDLSWPARVADYFWHITLPIAAMVIGGFASLTMLTKNAFLDEMGKQYVLTARAKGLSERRVLYGHVFRNAMLIVIAGFPAAFIGVLFTGALLVEVIFSLDGMGLLGFEAAINRDYPVMFATLYFFTLLGLVLHLIGDLMYVAIDPRIDFESRKT